ncbi:MAG: hypothetical protein ACR2MC_09525 [Actinomycetota bacterium]
MQRSYRLMGAAALVVAGLQLAACSPAPEEEVALAEPSHVEEIECSEFLQITLEERAAERLDLQTAQVVEEKMTTGESRGEQRKVIPEGALVWDPNGKAFAYTSTEPLVFVRAPLEIDYIERGELILRNGPAAGTEVVTVGAQELWGSETGVGH